MRKDQAVYASQETKNDHAERSGYGPTSILVFRNRSALPCPELEPALLECFKRQVTCDAQALGYRQPYALVVWQEENGHWTVVVPWQKA